MNDFDQAGRCLFKEDPPGQVHWVMPGMPSTIPFSDWLDSQIAPRPGEPDRRCDTIALLDDQTTQPWALVTELFTEPDAEALDRTLEYVFRFRRALRYGLRDDRLRFAAALVFLTGRPTETGLEMNLGGDSVLVCKPRVLCLQDEDALATLEAIRENRTAVSVLGWLPLMKGGQTDEAVAGFRELAVRLPDEQKQRTLASIAMVLAELTDSQKLWRKGLEGFAVRESTLMREMRNEGRDEGLKEGEIKRSQEMLAECLRLRSSQGPALESALQRVRAETDLGILSAWFTRALTTDKLDELIAEIATNA